MSLYDQLLEDRVDIDRLHSGRQRPPNKSTLIRPAFFQALRECEFPDDQIIRAYDRFQSIYEPAEPATQRVRRFRTKEGDVGACRRGGTEVNHQGETEMSVTEGALRALLCNSHRHIRSQYNVDRPIGRRSAVPNHFRREIDLNDPESWPPLLRERQICKRPDYQASCR